MRVAIERMLELLISGVFASCWNRFFQSPRVIFRPPRNTPPIYVEALELVAIASDGYFVSCVGMPCDQTNRIGIFEPACIHPDYRRKGLAYTLRVGGIQRLKSMGVDEVVVLTGDRIPANNLYDPLGIVRKK